MRISSIDVGSNAIRQVIVDVLPSGQWLTLKKYRAALRLGTDVFETGQIKPITQKELINVFKKMAKFNKKYKVKKTVAYATSAMRDAKNNAQVIRNIQRASKIKIEIITGQFEAELIKNAILKSKIINFDESLLLDIGGGSAEYTFIQNKKIISSQSFPLGVVRLLNQTKKTKKSIQEISEPYLKKVRNRILPQLKRNKINVVIGTGGNFDALSKLKIQLLKKTPNTNVTKAELKKIISVWNKMNLIQKESLDIRRDRIDVLGLALNLILCSMNEFGIQRIKIPLTGLKEGAIHSLVK